MPYFESLVKEGTRAAIHPAHTDLRRAVEQYHLDYLALNAALSELGCSCLLVLGRNYEYFTAALSHVRWDDQESLDERRSRLQPAVDKLEASLAEVVRLSEVVEALPEDIRKAKRGQDLTYLVSCVKRIHTEILGSFESARQR